MKLPHAWLILSLTHSPDGMSKSKVYYIMSKNTSLPRYISLLVDVMDRLLGLLGGDIFIVGYS